MTLVEPSRRLAPLSAAGQGSGPVARLLVLAAERGAAGPAAHGRFRQRTEFAQHRALHRLGVETFCCDAYAPWQKGGSKTRSAACVASGRAVWSSASSARAADRAVAAVQLQLYNITPRKCLDYRTPAGVFGQQLLQLQREPTASQAESVVAGRLEAVLRTARLKARTASPKRRDELVPTRRTRQCLGHWFTDSRPKPDARHEHQGILSPSNPSARSNRSCGSVRTLSPFR